MDIITGYSVTVSNYPVLWKSKFQTETNILTVEVEINEMAHIGKELFPIIYMVDILGQSVGMHFGYATINISINE